MEPLALDSSRWVTLKAHFGNAGQDTQLPSVPRLLARWHAAVGSYREEYDYDDLRESYLHQRTILDVAYAVVPHLSSRLAELDPDRRREILDDIAVVEKIRAVPPDEVEARVAKVGTLFAEVMREPMMQSIRDHHAPPPADLAPVYLAAIAAIDAAEGPHWRNIDDSDQSPQPHHWRRHLRYLRNAGWTDADIAFAVHALRSSTPDDDTPLIYRLSPAETREALARFERSPAGWLARTQLDAPAGELGFRAVHTLAWWSRLDIDVALAAPAHHLATFSR